MLSSQSGKKIRVLLSLMTNITAENAPMSARYLWCHRQNVMPQPIKIRPGAMS